MTRGEFDRFKTMLGTIAVATRADLDTPTIQLYFRALSDVPFTLLERAGVDLLRSSTFFPRPAEFRLAVDRLLDRQQQKQLVGAQQKLPGDVGEFTCERCDNTGWVFVEKPCTRPACFENKDGEHTHRWTTRCTDTTCVRIREQRRAERKRYSGAADAG